jgi:transposase-like protein
MKDVAETERARRASVVSAGGDPHPDPEVPAKAKRRQFSAEYRMRILREADACKVPGEVGALLRREGLYSSHLVLWRRQREAGALAGTRAKKRGPKARWWTRGSSSWRRKTPACSGS